jgi:hypothetical protein
MSNKVKLNISINPIKLIESIKNAIEIDIDVSKLESMKEITYVAHRVLEKVSESVLEMSEDRQLCMIAAKEFNLITEEYEKKEFEKFEIDAENALNEDHLSHEQKDILKSLMDLVKKAHEMKDRFKH